MKKSILLTLFSIFAFAFSVQAQDAERYSSNRLDNLANRLKGYTVDLADRTSEDLRRNNLNSRSELETAFLAQQLDASAGLFQQLVRDGRRAAELRDAAGILSDLVRRAPNYGSNRNLWRDAQNAIGDINRELGSGGGWNNGGNNNGNTKGRATWRGKVDDKVRLEISDRNIFTRTVAGKSFGQGNFNFTSALPSRSVTVDVGKKIGRGEVRVIQQPDRYNGYTAIIEITDADWGEREYELEIYWR